MRHLISFCLLVFGAMSTASASPVVVELFASQNCAACPKAHRTLETVSETRDDVLVLTWSVDYWDYLGEDDPMAMPESKTRQAAYVERFKLRGPYTPQSVYNGEKQCPGNRPRDVENNLEDVARHDGVAFAYDDGQLMISGDVPGPVEIWLVHFIPQLETEAAMVTNAVTSVTRLMEWQGASSLGIPVACDDGCAVLVQDAGYGSIRGAMRLH